MGCVESKVDEARIDEGPDLTRMFIADEVGDHLKGGVRRVGIDDDQEGSLTYVSDIVHVHEDAHQNGHDLLLELLRDTPEGKHCGESNLQSELTVLH